MPLTPASSRTAGLLTELFDSTLAAEAATFDTGAGGFSIALDHLLLVAQLRTTEALIISSAGMTFNNDSSANYDIQAVRGRDGTASSIDTQAGAMGFVCPGANAAAGVFAALMALVPEYGGTTAEKSLSWFGAFADEAATGGSAELRANHWRNTAAVSRIILTAGGGSNFAIGSRFTVYGIG